MWVLINAGVWSPGISRGDEDAKMVGVALLLNSDLMDFYAERKHRHPLATPLTEVGEFTAKMLGTRSKPKLKTKVAESYGILLFLLDRLGRHSAKVGATRAASYLEMGNILVGCLDTLHLHPAVFTADVVQEPLAIYISLATSKQKKKEGISIRESRHDQGWEGGGRRIGG